MTSYPDFESPVTACKAGYTPTLLAVGHHARHKDRMSHRFGSKDAFDEGGLVGLSLGFG